MSSIINDIFVWLNSLLTQNYSLILAASFIWGVLSIILSPCHLASIPLILGYINKRNEINIKNSFKISLLFSVGILTSILIIGLITALLGRIWGDTGFMNYIFLVLLFAAGLYLLDIINLPQFNFNSNNGNHSKKSFALYLGAMLGLVLGPCTFAFIAPVLGVAYQISSTNFLKAILIISLFGLGHIFTIITLIISSTKVQLILNWTENSKATVFIRKVSGVLVILAAIYLGYQNL